MGVVCQESNEHGELLTQVNTTERQFKSFGGIEEGKMRHIIYKLLTP